MELVAAYTNRRIASPCLLALYKSTACMSSKRLAAKRTGTFGTMVPLWGHAVKWQELRRFETAYAAPGPVADGHGRITQVNTVSSPVPAAPPMQPT